MPLVINGLEGTHTHAHAHTHTHTRTRTHTQAHMDTDVTDKSNFEKPGMHLYSHRPAGTWFKTACMYLANMWYVIKLIYN